MRRSWSFIDKNGVPPSYLNQIEHFKYVLYNFFLMSQYVCASSLIHLSDEPDGEDKKE